MSINTKLSKKAGRRKAPLILSLYQLRRFKEITNGLTSDVITVSNLIGISQKRSGKNWRSLKNSGLHPYDWTDRVRMV